MTPDRLAAGLSLIGLRGTGKTTVGRMLAERLGRDFADADVVLEARAGRSVRAVFAEGGEPAFRDWEERVVAELTAQPRLVLATGGGVVLRAVNRERLRALGPVVWLAAPPAVLAARLAADARGLDERPALTAAGTLDELEDVLRSREPLYRALADVTVETHGKTPDEVADAIIAGLLARGTALG